MYAGLEGKRVLITAGAAGLGALLGRQFIAEGAKVHCCDIDETALSVLRQSSPDITQSHADVSDPAAVDRTFTEALESLGGLDILVNNAGIAGPTASVEDMSFEDWSRTMQINIDGQFLFANRAIPHLKSAGGGVIINLSSVAGLIGCARRAPYVASKWAVIGFTKTLAMELGASNIRVNAICPGALTGDRMDRVIAGEAAATGLTEAEVRERTTQSNSLRRFIDPEDITSMILFLCSDASAKMTGQAITVDGHTETMR
jgi:NAD(P)-dependent dehydrogenase (short-subunit alcohol dehydrogenase family)